MNPFALAFTFFGLATAPAWGGGVLLCNEYGCRSTPYFPPPIVAIGPPAVYMPANPPTMAVPCRLWPGERVPGCLAPYQRGAPVRLPGQDATRQRGQPNYRTSEAPRPPPVSGPDPKAEIEADIMDFCDAHPDERFCGKLGSYLRQHPEAAPRH